ncbi:DUF3099 domain-containing protein [Streptomyces sp. UH6]|uniref:DUF3099 domain-containing protein n=1 Tax=Streptomyces sp. UH6 TaxID=2748379 RepID=UPI0015D4F219|nr:DUF3099 domain-containing protein [Streptomyces sp. UH6]NYV74645.1 DUF3099 domain-containing protein [Streptomyces sp. UH6]
MRKRRRSGSTGQVFRITGARQSLADDVGGRQRRYVISMLIRTLSVILAASLWNVQRPVAVVALVLGALLPYVAVVIANAGRENAPSLPSTFLSAPARPMIAPPRADAVAEPWERPVEEPVEAPVEGRVEAPVEEPAAKVRPGSGDRE